MAALDVLSTIIPSADHHLFLFLLLPLSLVLIIILFYINHDKIMISNRNKQKYSLPPCPPMLPLIGNIHQLIPPLHRSLHTLSEKHGPIFSLQLGTKKAIVVSSPEMAEQIFKTHDLTFASRPPSAAANAVNYGRSLNVSFTPYDDYWKWVRKLCITELLSSKRVQSFKSLINEELQNLIHSITSKRDHEIDLSDAVFSFSNDVMCRMVFGRKHSRDDRFREIFGEILELVVSFYFEDYWPGLGNWMDEVIGIKGRLRKRMKELDVFLVSMIEERISINIKEEEDIDDRSDHLIDVLLRMMKDVNSELEISKDHVKSILLDMFAAGTDTTATVLEWTMTELIRNPITLRKAQDEVRRVVGSKRNVEESDIQQLDYLNMVLKESFRLHPPAPLLVPRESMEDCCVIQNYYIPKCTRVFVNAWAIGRDEKYWDDPLAFRPERFIDGKVDFKGHDQFMLIPFGGGRRVCPGSNLEVYVAKITLANLLHRFDWELPIGMHVNDLDMEEAIGLTVHRKNSLHLIPKSKRHDDSN